MTLVGATYYIELAGICVERSTLGTAVSVERGEFSFMVQLPSAPDSYEYATMTVGNSEGDERYYVPKQAYIEAEPNSHLVEIRIVRVAINAEISLPASNPNLSAPDNSGFAQDLFMRFWNWALSAAQQFTDIVRASGQPWIEPAGRFPRILNVVSLYDVRSKLGLGFQMGRALDSFRVVDETGYLTATKMEAIEAVLRVEGGTVCRGGSSQ